MGRGGSTITDPVVASSAAGGWGPGGREARLVDVCLVSSSSPPSALGMASP